MKRIAFVVLALLAGCFFSGCIDTKQKGRDFVDGAIDAGASFAESKNKAALADAMASAAEVGINPHTVDADGDGFLSDIEAWNFTKQYAIEKAKADGKALVASAIAELRSGDIEGLKTVASEAKDSAVTWIEALAGLLATAAGTYRVVNWSRDRKYKRVKKEPVIDHGDKVNDALTPPK